jgi:subtilisin family serine protease
LLSTDGGATYPTTIATDEPNDGVYSWQVDVAPTTQARVKVIAYDAAGNDGEDVSDGNFTIADGTDPDVTVSAPNGGEVMDIDSFFDVQWIATDNIGVTSIDILLSTDGGATYPHTIATGEPNDGIYSWQVDVAPTTQARVKVIAYDAAGNDGEDVSDGNFTIADGTVPEVTVLVPNGGEVWEALSIQDITWDAADNIGVTSIDILLSSDGGATYPDTIATGEANDSVFSWQVDVLTTTQARIKVVAYDAAGNSGEDVSDADFGIYDPQSGVTEPEVPAGMVINGVNPNPFSRRTSVRFGIPKDGSVKLVVYDVSGRQVAHIADGYYPAGYHSVDWVAGGAVRTGIYFLSLRCGSEEVTRKVVISQ